MTKIYFQKLELDVFSQDSLQKASEFCITHGCPAMVVPHALYQQAFVLRGIRRGKYKIVTTVDWPNGSQYKETKFRGIPAECIGADSFEVLLTVGDKSNIQTEINYLSKMFRDHFPPTCGLRFVLGVDYVGRTEKNIIDMCSAIKNIATPELVRTTHAMQIENAEEAKNRYIKQVKLIRESCSSVPVKVCGMINPNIYEIGQIDRFAVTLKYATDLANAVMSKVETSKR